MTDMDTAKRLLTVGLIFRAPTGAEGTILEERSARGKVQAEFTCVKSGCSDRHVREISDWHQCGFCRTCKKPKGGAGGSVQGSNLSKVLESDPPELRALKEELAKAEAEMKAQQEAERKAALLQTQLAKVREQLAALRAKKVEAQPEVAPQQEAA